MKRTAALILVPILISAISGYIAFNWQNSQQSEQARHRSCLAAVIPTVTLHNSESEIISLLQELAQDTNTVLLEKPQPQAHFFSKDIDADLMQIAELFQAKQRFGASHTDKVNQAVERAVGLMKEAKLPFLAQCDELMKKVEQECGSLIETAPDNPSCYQKYNAQLEQFIPKKQQ